MSEPYASTLAPLLEQYLAYRSSIGFTSDSLRPLLRTFDQYAADNQMDFSTLTPSAFLIFKQGLTGAAGTRNQKISAARGFFKYLVRREIVSENPVKDIPADPENAYIPFVFSTQQTNVLLDAVENAIRREAQYFFSDLAVYTAIMLLARCGLRISEPTRLLIEHYNREEGSIYIKKTKFHKDRLIPLPKMCIVSVENYLSVREVFIANGQNPYLLPGQEKKKLSHKRIYAMFHQAVKSLGIYQPRRIIANTVFGAPTPHSLRHSFAINTLKSIRDNGGSPQEALPILSAYLGHRKYRYTAVYLKVMDAGHRQNLVDFAINRQEEL